MSRIVQTSKSKNFISSSNDSLNKKAFGQTNTSQSMKTESYEYFSQKITSNNNITESSNNNINQISNSINSQTNYIPKKRVLTGMNAQIEGQINTSGLKCTCKRLNENMQKLNSKCTCKQTSAKLSTGGKFRNQHFEEEKESNKIIQGNSGYQSSQQQRIISDRLNEQIKIRAYQKVQLNRKLNQLKISKKNRYNNKKIFNLIENAKKRHTNERKKEIIDLVIKHLFKFITAINNVNGKRNSEQQVKDFYSFANEDCQKIINYIQTTTFFKSFTSLSKGKEKAGNDIVFSFNTELLEDFDNLRDNFEKDLLKEKNVANIIYSLFFMYYFVGGYSDDVKNTKLTIRGANQYDKILKMCEVANNMKPMNCDSLIRNGYSEDDVKMLLEEMSTNNNYNCVEIESLKRNNVNNDGNIDFLFKKNVFDYYATDDFKKKTIENIQQKILFLKKTITLINDFF